MQKQGKHTLHFSQRKTITLVHSGEDYFSRLRHIILHSQSEIHIQTYIFDISPAALEIIDDLKAAATRKVKIYVLIDGYGSSSFPASITNELISVGIHIRFFAPLFSANTFYLGRRLHHKIVVADGHIALVGGINISSKYRGSAIRQPWLDYAIQIEDSETANRLQQLCRNIYFKKKRNKIDHISPIDKTTSIQIVRNDWLKRKNEISRGYIKAIRNSSKEIIIVGGYFFPGRRLKNALKKASRRGVKVKLILSGISDIPLIRRATCYLYTYLLKNNFELFEWNKSVLHGKVAVIDKIWSTIGSFNLNYLSIYGSIELNIEVHAPDFSEKLSIHLHHIIDQCERITYKTIETRKGILTTILNWIAYRIMRTAFIIVTYIPHKRLW